MGKKNTTETISISIETHLLSALDFCCYQRDITRSAAAREAIKQWISTELSHRPDYWERVYHEVANNSNQKKIF